MKKQIEIGDEEIAYYLRGEKSDAVAVFVAVSLKNDRCPVCRTAVEWGYEMLYKHFMAVHQSDSSDMANRTYSMLQQFIKFIRTRHNKEGYRKRCEVVYVLNRDLPIILVSDLFNLGGFGEAGEMAYQGMVSLKRVPKWVERVISGEGEVVGCS
jgi:hypothetical protein